MNFVRYYHLVCVKQEIIQRKLGLYAESRVGTAHILKSTYFSIEKKPLPLPLRTATTSIRCILKLGSEASTTQSNISERSAYQVFRHTTSFSDRQSILAR